MINNKSDLIDYVLRKLGAPVINIELDEEQIADRVDDAIEFFQEIHYDGTERIYLKHQITQNDINLAYIPIPDEIIGVAKVIPFTNNITSTNYLDYAFDPKYQVMVSELYNIASASFVYFTQIQQHLSLLDQTLRPLPTVEFNRKVGKLYMNVDWSRFKVGDYIVFECFRAVDPNTYPKVYNDRLFKEYVTALVKMQWGNNLKKFEGVQTIGGVTLNGQIIYNEAAEEIIRLEEKIRNGYELPPMGFVD